MPIRSSWSALFRPPAGKTSLARAVEWIRTHRAPGGGVVPHHKHAIGSQEVTGYLIPTLWDLGERDMALEMARWEASVQRPDGAFTAPDGTPYTFDTAQAVRGFLSLLDFHPEFEVNIRRACGFILTQIEPDGRVSTPSYALWRCADGSTFTEYANLYVVPPLLAAGTRLGEPAYSEAASHVLASYKRRADLVEFKPELGTLSHIFGYMMEALVDLGEIELARRGLAQAAAIQSPDGAIPAYPGVKWICSTGMAQLAIAWYKLGDRAPADRAVAYLEPLQLANGGFYGSYGPGATYLPGEEISWAVKFFIDCCTLRAKQSKPGSMQRGADEEPCRLRDR
jgi:malonyl-CoA O-methyltransferase